MSPLSSDVGSVRMVIRPVPDLGGAEERGGPARLLGGISLGHDAGACIPPPSGGFLVMACMYICCRDPARETREIPDGRVGF